jgi:hypothetical protein
MALARAAEDKERDAKSESEDKDFEASRQSRFSALEHERELELRVQSTAAESAIAAMKKQQEQFLAELRKRQSDDLSMLRADLNEQRKVIESTITTKRNNLSHEVVRNNADRLELRQREDGTLKRRRESEDVELKNEVFEAFDAEVLGGIPPAQKEGGTGMEVASSNKRQRVDTNPSALEKEVAALTAGPKPSKRQMLKVERRRHPENHALATITSRDTNLDFELKAMRVDDSDGRSDTWKADTKWVNLPKEVRALHFNAELNALEMYAGEENLTTKHPEYALCTTGESEIYFDEDMDRLATGSRRTGWLQLEFYGGELETFIELCRTHFPRMNLFGVSPPNRHGISFIAVQR